MSTEKIYKVPCPAPIRDIVESVLLTENELTEYRRHLACLAPQPTRRARRTRDQMILDIANCTRGAIPSAFGTLARNALRREALALYPESPLADKVAKNSKWVAVI